MKISWFQFVFLNAFLTVLLNFNGFIFVYKNLSSNQLWLTLALIIAYACLVHMILCVLFVKFLSKFFSTILLITTGMSAYLTQSYGTLIDSGMLRNVLNTDTKEAFDLVNIPLILLVLGLIIISFLILKATIFYPPFKRQLGVRLLNIFLALGIFCAVFLPLTESFVPFFRTYNEMRMYDVPFYQFYALFRYYQTYLVPKAELKTLSNEAYRENNTTKRDLVLVIGETARAANYSLGEYKNQANLATPHEGVTYFDKVSSCGTPTAVSLPCIFSASKKNDFSNRTYEEDLLDFIDKMGANTTWLDNNSGGCQGVCQRLKQTHIFKEEYDGFLIEEFKKTLANLDMANFIIVHLQESRRPAYYERYPKEFEKFTPTRDTNELSKCTPEQIASTYDNTILYTDWMVEEMIDELKTTKDYQNILVCISDHGEGLGENGIYLYGLPYAIAPKMQTHIPMILWSNDKNLQNIVLKHRNLATSHDSTFSTILGYFEIKTPFYEEEFNFLNLKFGKKK